MNGSTRNVRNPQTFMSSIMFFGFLGSMASHTEKVLVAYRNPYGKLKRLIGPTPPPDEGPTTVEVDRSAKVRCDSRKRSAEREVSRFWQISGYFPLLLERVRCNLEYIGKTEFFGSSLLYLVTGLVAIVLIIKDKIT